MSNQLTDMDVQVISLVKKGANGEKIAIYKSAEVPDSVNNSEGGENMNMTLNTATMNEQDKSLVSKIFELVKGAPKAEIAKEAPKTEVAKATDIPLEKDWNDFDSLMNDKRGQIWDAMYTLEDAICNIFWDDSVTNGTELILKNIDEFKAYVQGVLSQTVEVQKSFFVKKDATPAETVAKAEETPAETVAKAEETPAETIAKSEATTVTADTIVEGAVKANTIAKAEETPAETVAKAEEKPAEVDVSSLIAKALEPVISAVAEIKKSVDGLNVDTKLDGLKSEVAKSIEGVETKVSAIETTRVLPNGQASDKSTVAKSDPWAGVLPGLFGGK